MDQKAFENTVVVVTGAASGIGRELSLQAAARAAVVVATDRAEGELAQTKRLGGEKGLKIETALLDVSVPGTIESFVRETIPFLNKRKLILVNNAGVGLASGAFEHTELGDFEWLLNINLWGAIRLTKAFYPYFLQQSEGHIVNISSVFGLIGVAANTAYCTSKFGLRGFTESLRMELKGTGIYTTLVHPGGIKTNIVRNSRVNAGAVTEETHRKSIAAFEKKAGTTPGSAAKQILRAIERKKERLVIGKDGLAIDLLARLLPVRYTGILYAQLKQAFGVEDP